MEKISVTKKYNLKLTEGQAQALVMGLESFMRLGIAQYNLAIEMALPGKLLPGYNKELEESFQTIKKNIYNIVPSMSLSLWDKEMVSETVRVAHDIYEVIRHKLAWDRHPEGGFTVDFNSPLKISDTENLPIITNLD